jgi:hypothetical protein
MLLDPLCFHLLAADANQHPGDHSLIVPYKLNLGSNACDLELCRRLRDQLLFRFPSGCANSLPSSSVTVIIPQRRVVPAFVIGEHFGVYCLFAAAETFDNVNSGSVCWIKLARTLVVLKRQFVITGLQVRLAELS